jgi:hypothetical protein
MHNTEENEGNKVGAALLPPLPSVKNRSARLFRAARPGDRKRYFRGAGLRSEAWVAEVTNEKARRCAAASKLQGWLGCGVLVFQGARAWITYAPEHAAAVTARIQQLRAQEKLRLCGTGNGAVCLAPDWAKVSVDRVVIEVCAGENAETLKS